MQLRPLTVGFHCQYEDSRETTPLPKEPLQYCNFSAQPNTTESSDEKPTSSHSLYDSGRNHD